LTYSNRFLVNADVVTITTNTVQRVLSRADRVYEILDYPENIADNEHIDITKINGDIVFKNVSFVNNGEKMLNKVSFTIPPGSSVALVGPTGSGKSSITKLLSKLEPATEGSVTVDGIDLREIKSQSYYRRMGIAFEKPFIFKGTIADNLLYGIRRALPENVMKVAARLGCHDFIERLEHGYETELSENTYALTTSQKQAINVARTILQAPDLLIINEALSALDAETEKQMFDEIIKMDKKRTVVFVTHRLAAVENCDIILFMDKGKVAERGTHAELMRKKGKYYRAVTNI
jgi:ATP-binding cassette subfamily B protein